MVPCRCDPRSGRADVGKPGRPRHRSRTPRLSARSRPSVGSTSARRPDVAGPSDARSRHQPAVVLGDRKQLARAGRRRGRSSGRRPAASDGSGSRPCPGRRGAARVDDLDRPSSSGPSSSDGRIQTTRPSSTKIDTPRWRRSLRPSASAPSRYRRRAGAAGVPMRAVCAISRAASGAGVDRGADQAEHPPVRSTCRRRTTETPKKRAANPSEDAELRQDVGDAGASRGARKRIHRPGVGREVRQRPHDVGEDLGGTIVPPRRPSSIPRAGPSAPAWLGLRASDPTSIAAPPATNANTTTIAATRADRPS